MTKAAFQFSDFPLELRELIWEHTLPPPRLFQLHSLLPPRAAIAPELQRLYKLWFPQRGTNDPAPVDLRHMSYFAFRVRHTPPIATQVCRESRNVALRAGYFLLPAASPSAESDQAPGVTWFGGRTDVLYYPISREAHLFNYRDPTTCLPNSDLIRHVGVEWRILLRGVPAPWQRTYDGEREGWRDRMLMLYDQVPGLEAVHLVLPTAYTINYSTTRSFGGEPQGYDRLKATLTPLPLTERIPISRASPSWAEVLEALRNEFDDENNRQRVADFIGACVKYPPEVSGLSLKRGGTPA
ncbi:hypothetical protein VUR80DRAFT_4909 [Thermomyces stellatus]